MVIRKHTTASPEKSPMITASKRKKLSSRIDNRARTRSVIPGRDAAGAARGPALSGGPASVAEDDGTDTRAGSEARGGDACSPEDSLTGAHFRRATPDARRCGPERRPRPKQE